MKRSAYSHYSVFTKRFAKFSRRQLGVPKGQEAEIIRSLTEEPDFAKSLDARVMILEHQLRHGTVLVPEPSLSQGLSRIKLERVEGEAWTWPFEFSLVSVPTTQTFAGQPSRGIMVAWVDRHDLQNRYWPEFLEAYSSNAGAASLDLEGKLLTITVPAEPAQDGELAGFPTVLHTAMDAEDISRFINAEALSENHDDSALSAELSPSERDYLRDVIRYLLSMGMYLSAYPEALKPGVPEYMRNKHPITREKATPRFASIAADEGKAFTEALSAPRHVPSHWRQLRHERFYQGRHSHLPRGTRYVLVSGYSTGKERTMGVINADAD